MASVVTLDARDAASPQLRGWGRYAACLLEALTALEPADIELDVLTQPSGPLEVAFEQLTLPRHLRRRGAALVHATNCFLPLRRPCPGVATVHDLAFEAWPRDFRLQTRWKYRVLARLAARSAERVIVPSQFTAADLVRRYGVQAQRIRVIPEAPALPHGSLLPPPGPYVLAVGDLRRKKNLRPLVSAFARVRRRHGMPHRLILAGVDSGEGAALRALGEGPQLELTGYVSNARLDALIRGADLLVHPSLYEGFGLVLLEAMARGTAVLAARATALPETAGDAAAYFDPDRPGALELALEQLLQDESARAELEARGPRHAAGFSWERTARRTIEVYRELL